MKTYLSWSGGKDSTASIILCYCENLVSQYFMYNKTFQEVEEQVNAINNQLTLFDFIKL